jgi:catechol 2,3-dioxygenase-like lactoylglutathione lyase family enzyme
MAGFSITRLNHMVLYVRDAQRSASFYHDVLGFSVVEQYGDRAVFMRASGSNNHHDLGLFGVGVNAPGPTQGERVGMYHAAWELGSIDELGQARAELLRAGALVGENDHGNSLSLYIKDPDGLEHEIFWLATNRADQSGRWAPTSTGPQHYCRSRQHLGETFPTHAAWREHMAQAHGLPMVNPECRTEVGWACSGLDPVRELAGVSSA